MPENLRCLFTTRENILVLGEQAFLVEDKVMIEIKAIIQLEAAAAADVHLAQAINYLKAYNLEVGLLINRTANRFGSKSLTFKRVMKSNRKRS